MSLSIQPAVRRVALPFWIASIVAVVAWALEPGYVVGWDLRIYGAALASLHAGHDPYLDAIAIQRAFHALGPHPPGTVMPFSYVYSPITLPLVRAAARLPLALDATLYWLAYVAALAGGILGASWWMVDGKDRQERAIFACLLPLTVFFPGMLENDVLFSGNIACILYGAVFAAALLGWTRGRWWPFYVAVVVASCFKAPLLCLVVIAPLSARNQWRATLLACAAGVTLFVVQPHFAPVLFRHYLEAVELQFSFNRDFSASVAGLLADGTYDLAPYQLTSALGYAATVLAVGGVLLVLRRRYLQGAFSLRQWVPLVVLGAVLLNPRIMEYDLAPATFAMTLLLWRAFRTRNGPARAGFLLLVVFALLNGVGAVLWKPMACVATLLAFAAGAWQLWTTDDNLSDIETDSAGAHVVTA